jgi:hypothetical protein
LQTIQRVWQTGRDPEKIVLRLLLLRNVHAIMTNLLSPIANILLDQKLDTGDPEDDLVAAPCFNYFRFNTDGPDKDKPGAPKTPKELHESLYRLAYYASRDSPTEDVKKSLKEIQVYITNKIPPE